MIRIAILDNSQNVSRRVTDWSILSPEFESGLGRRLDRFQREKGAHVGVVIVASTAPESIESYGLRLAENWKVGRKGVDDGAV